MHVRNLLAEYMLGKKLNFFFMHILNFLAGTCINCNKALMKTKIDENKNKQVKIIFIIFSKL